MPAEQLSQSPTLAHLLRGFASLPAVSVTGIASDSRRVRRGDVFLACQGAASHGVDYLDEARRAGASAIVWDASTAAQPDDIGIPMFAVEKLSERLGEIANRYYANPSDRMRVAGVTGTNGKTTVAWWIAHCLRNLDATCGYLGTLGYGVDDLRVAEGMTTPATIELHGRLAGFVEQGATDAAIEISSHALSQHRVDGVRFDATLFTNLTRDHLDYHGDMQSYFESKARLFLEHDSRVRIVNVDTDFGAELATRCGPDAIRVASNTDRIDEHGRHLLVRSATATQQGTDVAVTSSWGDGQFLLPVPGDFNVANAATVLAYLLSRGIGIDKACELLALTEAPPGRMQRIGSNANVYVDYAHTPNAIESALKALRPHCKGALYCVFGCGGDRDTGKRPMMGQLAERFADAIVITSDNPRREEPAQIIGEIVAGCAQPRAATVIEDRATAIAYAVARAGADDVVLIAGKGHEAIQEIGDERLPFSDAAIASAALAAKEARQ